MTPAANSLVAPDFLTLTLGVVVYFAGVIVTRNLAFLRNYNIPEPVTGGFLAAVVLWVFHAATGWAIGFEMIARDRLLVIFFAAVGINARLSDLLAGGRALIVLCVLTTIFVFLQNVVGMLGASLFGLPSAAGVIMGSIALVGGHGTAIAWAPAIAAEHGFPAAIETGAAVATLGLIVASLLGGPVAKFLIERQNLIAGIAAAGAEDTAPKADAKPIDKSSFMYALLMINIAVILGYLVHRPITEMGIKLPLFVPCLIMGIVLSNTVPLIFPKLPWPARTPSLALISDYALSVFLAISLMSMQLWTLAEIAGPLLVVVAIQAVAAVAFIVLALFPLLGRDYQAAVLSAGFTGLSLGATPTAIASMTAVTEHYGPSPNAFIILPLVSAFFVDIINVIAIKAFLAL
ncbi:glutamate:Na+ symporter, ESS family [Bradyrhizobium lablabi]|uniref:Sodium/glutamate symporter n=1 Tax=Bradyrhizobium lablabi TaxID=722472 RepID=A0A1M6JTN5_9BRAD|nr:sodium/glutamate symporter [Bradyrhizobium lablabi]SHJ50026.1 glutamate:Na+ symporter, ESS family [Bradyrhizobium lablabi]